MTELGRLCSKKRCFNDLSVSPMYMAGHFLHDIWYIGPTTLSFCLVVVVVVVAVINPRNFLYLSLVAYLFKFQ